MNKMRRRFAVLGCRPAFVISSSSAQDLTSKFDANKMRERVKRLSQDDFEGRGPGTAGGKLAAQYIADQFKAIGAKPANRGSYFQNVALVGVKADRDDSSASAKSATVQRARLYKFGDDFVATTGAQTANVSVKAELVFVGYGIDAPLYKWNDYKGRADDYKGKVLMMLVNDPPATTDEPDLFGGKALTYYGRWTYKYEEAARRGAAGVILVHTTDPRDMAGMSFALRTATGVTRSHERRGQDAVFCNLNRGRRMTQRRRCLSSRPRPRRASRGRQSSRDFQARKDRPHRRLNLKSEVKNIRFAQRRRRSSRAATEARKRVRRLFRPLGPSRHRRGRCQAATRSTTARTTTPRASPRSSVSPRYSRKCRKERPKRSFLFLFPTAEEQGLLGAEYYSTHPLVPLAKTVADINLDGVNIFGKVRDFTALGAERSSIMRFY